MWLDSLEVTIYGVFSKSCNQARKDYLHNLFPKKLKNNEFVLIYMRYDSISCNFYFSPGAYITIYVHIFFYREVVKTLLKIASGLQLMLDYPCAILLVSTQNVCQCWFSSIQWVFVSFQAKIVLRYNLLTMANALAKLVQTAHLNGCHWKSGEH